MSTVKVNEVRHLSNSGTANIVLESNATTNLQATSTLGLTVTGTLTVSGLSTFNGNVVIGNATTDTLDLQSKVTGFNNFSGFTGEIRMYAGNAAGDDPPDGWLYCNGDTISQLTGHGGTHYNADGKGNDYQPLFNLLKESSDWGNSSGSTWGANTVKTTDFRSRAPVGIHTGAATSITAGLTSRTLSDAVGTETHALVTAELAAHTHSSVIVASATGQTINNPTHTHTVPSGTSGSTTPGVTGGPSNNTTSSGSPHTHAGSGAEDYKWLLRKMNDGRRSPGVTDTTIGEPDLLGTGTMYIESAHTHTMQSHTHTSAAHTHSTPGSTTSATAPSITLTDPNHTHTLTAASTGSGTAHTNLSPIIAVNYIIKV